MNQVNLAEEKITYKKLLEHIQEAEVKLEHAKKWKSNLWKTTCITHTEILNSACVKIDY